jgi:5-methylcytosine-specific restriction endonuclease McrA
MVATMKPNKKQRQTIFDKSDGHCWYCGCGLPVKGWHADHVEPIRRYKDFRITEERVEHFENCDSPHLDTLENMVPACRKCNLFKGVFSVEEFRREISKQVTRSRDYSVNFRTAERFGLIEIVDKPVLFWFEKNDKVSAIEDEG